MPKQKTVALSIRIPKAVIQKNRNHPLLKALLPVSTGYFAYAQGHYMQRKRCDEYIMIYNTRGKGFYESMGKRFEILEGQILFCLTGPGHTYWADEQDPWTIYWAHFTGSEVPHFLQLCGINSQYPVSLIGEQVKIITLFQELYSALQARYSLHHLVTASACLRQIWSQLLLATLSVSHPSANDLHVENIIQYFLQQIDQPLTLKEVARHFFYSPSHFSRKFHQKTGYAPIEYFIRLKMQKAGEMLAASTASIKSISQTLGYDDPYYFSRLFKKVLGDSPKIYRFKFKEKLEGIQNRNES